jgi:DNA-binding LacI/PurR family transcriptional regulator
LARAASHGYRGEEFWLHQDGMSPDRFSEMLHARGIQGVLIGPPADGAEIPNLKWKYFAGVCLSVPSPSLSITTVCNDHYFSALRAVRECHKRGYRRPGLVVLKSHRDRYQGRWEAGCLVAREFMEDLTLVPSLKLDTWENALGESLKRWIEHERPDVILTPNANALLPHLTRLGLRAPDDIGLVSLACAGPDDRISGIYQNGELIGATAIDVLINRVEQHELGLPEQANSLMIEGVWVSGKTLRA